MGCVTKIYTKKMFNALCQIFKKNVQCAAGRRSPWAEGRPHGVTFMGEGASSRALLEFTIEFFGGLHITARTTPKGLHGLHLRVYSRESAL